MAKNLLDFNIENPIACLWTNQVTLGKDSVLYRQNWQMRGKCERKFSQITEQKKGFYEEEEIRGRNQIKLQKTLNWPAKEMKGHEKKSWKMLHQIEPPINHKITIIGDTLYCIIGPGFRWCRRELMKWPLLWWWCWWWWRSEWWWKIIFWKKIEAAGDYSLSNIMVISIIFCQLNHGGGVHGKWTNSMHCPVLDSDTNARSLSLSLRKLHTIDLRSKGKLVKNACVSEWQCRFETRFIFVPFFGWETRENRATSSLLLSWGMVVVCLVAEWETWGPTGEGKQIGSWQWTTTTEGGKRTSELNTYAHTR